VVEGVDGGRILKGFPTNFRLPARLHAIFFSGTIFKNLLKKTENHHFFITHIQEIMSVVSPFISAIEKDHMHYLLHQHAILSLTNETRITNTDKAIELFGVFFTDMKEKYVSLEKIDFYAREIEHRYLVLFLKELMIGDTDYETKTKIKALYVSVFIQRTLELRMKAKESFWEDLRVSMLDVVKVCNQTKPVVSVNGEVFFLAIQWNPEREPIQAPTPLPEQSTVYEIINKEDEDSFLRFYAAIKEAQRWQTHAKWEKLAFYCASLACGEGVWYCPGGAAKPETLRRKLLFSIVEKVDNKYNKAIRKNKKAFMNPMSAIIPPGASGGLNTSIFSNQRLPIGPQSSFIPSSRAHELLMSTFRGFITPVNMPVSSTIPHAVPDSTPAATIPHAVPDSTPAATTTTPVPDSTVQNSSTESSSKKRKLIKVCPVSKKGLGAMGFNPLLLYPYLPPPEDYTKLLDPNFSRTSALISTTTPPTTPDVTPESNQDRLAFLADVAMYVEEEKNGGPSRL
jgi:hypothetical protein